MLFLLKLLSPFLTSRTLKAWREAFVPHLTTGGVQATEEVCHTFQTWSAVEKTHGNREAGGKYHLWTHVKSHHVNSCCVLSTYNAKHIGVKHPMSFLMPMRKTWSLQVLFVLPGCPKSSCIVTMVLSFLKGIITDSLKNAPFQITEKYFSKYKNLINSHGFAAQGLSWAGISLEYYLCMSMLVTSVAGGRWTRPMQKYEKAPFFSSSSSSRF